MPDTQISIESLHPPLEPGIRSSEILMGMPPFDASDPDSFTSRIIEKVSTPEFSNNPSHVVVYRPHMAYMTDESAALMRQLCYLGVNAEDAFKTVFFLQKEIQLTPDMSTTIPVPSQNDPDVMEEASLVVSVPRFIDQIDPETAEVTRVQSGVQIIINPRITETINQFFVPYEEKRQKNLSAPHHVRVGEDEQTYFLIAEIGELQRNHPSLLGRIIISPLCYTVETVNEFEQWTDFFSEHQMAMLNVMGAMAVNWGTLEEQAHGKEPEYILDYIEALQADLKASLDPRGRPKREGLTVALAMAADGAEHYKQSIIALLRTTDMVAKGVSRNTAMLQRELRESGLSADAIYSIVASDVSVASAIQGSAYGETTVRDSGHTANQAYGPAALLFWEQGLNVAQLSDSELIAAVESHPEFKKTRNAWEVYALQAFIYIYYIMPNSHAPSDKFPEDTEASFDVINAFARARFAEWTKAGLFAKILDLNRRKKSLPIGTIEVLSEFELRGMKFPNDQAEFDAFGEKLTPHPELLGEYLDQGKGKPPEEEPPTTLSAAEIQRLMQLRKKKKKH